MGSAGFAVVSFLRHRFGVSLLLLALQTYGLPPQLGAESLHRLAVVRNLGHWKSVSAGKGDVENAALEADQFGRFEKYAQGRLRRLDLGNQVVPLPSDHLDRQFFCRGAGGF